MKQRKIILVLLPLATIILELFPCGAVLNFGRGLEEGGGLIKETYSYFSLLPVSGELGERDIERIGINIRDWISQVGA